MDDITVPECEFNDYFDELAKWRGYEYFKEGRVKTIEVKDNTYHATVQGSKIYNVSFKYENNDITQMKCSCPFFEKGINCKHLYAVIFKEFGHERQIKKSDYEQEVCPKKESIFDISSKEDDEPKVRLVDKVRGFLGAIQDITGYHEVSDEERKEQDLEEEMDILGLDEDEKEIVREGEWEPWQFETDPDDFDEEDYYHEDDF